MSKLHVFLANLPRQLRSGRLSDHIFLPYVYQSDPVTVHLVTPFAKVRTFEIWRAPIEPWGFLTSCLFLAILITACICYLPAVWCIRKRKRGWKLAGLLPALFSILLLGLAPVIVRGSGPPAFFAAVSCTWLACTLSDRLMANASNSLETPSIWSDFVLEPSEQAAKSASFATNTLAGRLFLATVRGFAARALVSEIVDSLFVGNNSDLATIQVCAALWLLLGATIDLVVFFLVATTRVSPRLGVFDYALHRVLWRAVHDRIIAGDGNRRCSALWHSAAIFVTFCAAGFFCEWIHMITFTPYPAHFSWTAMCFFVIHGLVMAVWIVHDQGAEPQAKRNSWWFSSAKQSMKMLLWVLVELLLLPLFLQPYVENKFVQKTWDKFVGTSGVALTVAALMLAWTSFTLIRRRSIDGSHNKNNDELIQ